MFSTVTCGCLRNDRPGYFIIFGTCHFLFSITKYITVHKLQKCSYNTKCIIIFTISQLWLTFHPRSTVVLLDTGTPGTSREIYSQDADGETRTRNPSVIN